MIRTDKRMRLCLFLLICNLIFIWGNSLMPGEVSQTISDWVQDLLFDKVSRGSTASSGSSLLRKAAHFTEFAALGFLFAWRFGMLGKQKLPAFLWGAGAACIDETIQAFVPERAPRIFDVVIDCGGVLTGMVLLYLGHHYCKKRST